MEIAERWVEAAGRVWGRARDTGVAPLIPPGVWVATADLDTWGPGEARSVDAALARVLGGRTARPPGAGGIVEAGGELPWSLGLWQGDPTLVTATSVLEPRMLVGGVPDGPGGPVGGLLGSGLVRLVRECGVPDRHAGLVPLGGAVLEAAGAVGGNIRGGAGGSRDPRWAQMVAVCRLAGGDRPAQVVVGARLVGDHCTVVVPGWPGGAVHVPLGALVTTDPRLARRFLEVFDWTGWVGGSAVTSGGDAVRAVGSWLAAVAPGDRAAARMLIGHRLWKHPDLRGPVTLALRAAGAGSAAPGPPRGGFRAGDAPVLWWRWVLARLVTARDRPRAVEGVETAWVRLCGGRI